MVHVGLYVLIVKFLAVVLLVAIDCERHDCLVCTASDTENMM